MTTRIRSRLHADERIAIGPFEYLGKREGYTDNVIQYPAVLTNLYQRDEEYIEDDVGGGKGKKPERPVKHWRLRHFFDLQHVASHQTDTSISPAVNHYGQGRGVSFGFISPDVSMFSPDVMATMSSDEGKQRLIDDTVNRFYDTNDVEAFVNLAEADQTVSLVKQIVGVARNWRKIGGFFKLPTRQKAKILANSHLAYSFGIAPLISDIAKLWGNVGDVTEKYEQFVKRSKKLVRVTRTTKDQMCFLRSGSKVLQYDGPYSRNVVHTKNCVHRCIVKGRYHIPYHYDIFGLAQNVIDRFGANGPVSLAWELVPYSFVIDWFIDTRNLLNHLDNLAMGCRKEITSITFSTREEGEIWTSVRRNSATFIQNVPPEGAVIGRHKFTRYTRFPTDAQYGLKLRSVFGKRQFALSCSLLTQFLLRAKAR